MRARFAHVRGEVIVPLHARGHIIAGSFLVTVSPAAFESHISKGS